MSPRSTKPPCWRWFAGPFWKQEIPSFVVQQASSITQRELVHDGVGRKILAAQQRCAEGFSLWWWTHQYCPFFDPWPWPSILCLRLVCYRCLFQWWNQRGRSSGESQVFLGYFLRRCFCRDFGLRLRFSTGMIVHRHFCWRKQVDGSTSFSCSFSKCLSGKGFLWIASSQGHSNKNSSGQACSWIRTVHFGRILGGLLDGS